MGERKQDVYSLIKCTKIIPVLVSSILSAFPSYSLSLSSNQIMAKYGITFVCKSEAVLVCRFVRTASLLHFYRKQKLGHVLP